MMKFSNLQSIAYHDEIMESYNAIVILKSNHNWTFWNLQSIAYHDEIMESYNAINF